MAMSSERRAAYWAAAALAVLAFLWLLNDILAPFVFGAAIAYFLDPVADWFERHGFSRPIATALVTLIALVTVGLGLLVLVPPLVAELDSAMRSVPGMIQDFRKVLSERFALDISANVDTSILSGNGNSGEGQGNGGVAREVTGAAKNIGLGALRGLLSGGTAVLGALATIGGAAIVAFYMLLDWDHMVARVDGWLPRRYAGTIRSIASDIDDVLARFLRGQIMVCLILGAFYAIALSLLGLKFGLLVGVVSGIICFIPLVGSFVGLILSTGLALSQFWGEWIMIAAVAGVFIFGQLVEGNVLTPYLVGSSVGLHPVWLIFALSAFGTLFGFAGLLLAVPVAAAIGVIARRGIERYKISSLYCEDRAG